MYIPCKKHVELGLVNCNIVAPVINCVVLVNKTSYFERTDPFTQSNRNEHKQKKILNCRWCCQHIPSISKFQAKEKYFKFNHNNNVMKNNRRS